MPHYTRGLVNNELGPVGKATLRLIDNRIANSSRLKLKELGYRGEQLAHLRKVLRNAPLKFPPLHLSKWECPVPPYHDNPLIAHWLKSWQKPESASWQDWIYHLEWYYTVRDGYLAEQQTESQSG